MACSALNRERYVGQTAEPVMVRMPMRDLLLLIVVVLAVMLSSFGFFIWL